MRTEGSSHEIIIDKASIVTRLMRAGSVFADAEAQVLMSAARTSAELSAMVDQRVSGLPLEHIIGWAEFCGLRIKVAQGVFVPRSRTEFLVREAAALAQSGAIVLDLCCGSGAVGVALTAAVNKIELHATDIDQAAVRCAYTNVNAVGGHVYEGDLFESLPIALWGRIDILVANAPYVPTDSIQFLPPEARLHESRLAFDGGVDGHDVQRRVAAAAPYWLSAGGHLLVETSERQALQTLEIFAHNGLIPRVARFEEMDATVVIGTMPHLK